MFTPEQDEMIRGVAAKNGISAQRLRHDIAKFEYPPSSQEALTKLQAAITTVASTFADIMETLRQNPVFAAMMEVIEEHRQEEARRMIAKRRYERRMAGRQKRKKGKGKQHGR